MTDQPGRAHDGDLARLRRARSLVGFWEQGAFVVENYLTGKQTTTAPVIAQLLQTIEDYTPHAEVLERFGRIPSAAAVVAQLVAGDLLIAEGSALDAKDRLLDQRWTWRHDVRYLHYSSQQIRYQDDFEAERASLAQLAQTTPPPSPFKEYGHYDVALSGSFTDAPSELWQVLRARRTRRACSGQPISRHDLSTILLWTWGRADTRIDPEVGPYLLKTSPSGGARHPIEVYPLILRVADVAPGLYHYSVKGHALECLRPGLFTDLAVRLCANQPWVADAAAIFFMTAVVERNMWKYQQAHAYRVLHLEAGHLGQTFQLICTRLRLAPFTSGALDDAALEQTLGIDGVTEIPIYTAVVGVPATPFDL